MKLARGQLGELAASICQQRELDAEREMGERLELLIASRYDLLALCPAFEEERRIIAGQDNHGALSPELRQDLLDEQRVGLMEADVHSSKRSSRGGRSRASLSCAACSLANCYPCFA